MHEHRRQPSIRMPRTGFREGQRDLDVAEWGIDAELVAVWLSGLVDLGGEG